MLLAFLLAGAPPEPAATPFAAARTRLDAAEAALRAAPIGDRALLHLTDAALDLAAASSPADDAARLDAIVDALLLLAHLAPEGGDAESSASILLDAIPRAAGPLLAALTAARWDKLAALPEHPDPASLVATLAAADVKVNPYVDALDPLGRRAAALRPVQPAVVRIWGNGAGTGVNLSPEGSVLTNAHLPERLGAEMTVEFPDGSRYRGRCDKYDEKRDLALLTLDHALALPVAALADAPPEAWDSFVMIGHPGSPSGFPPPFRVIEGKILAIRAAPDGWQGIGAVAHDAPTAWGNSGSPMFDAEGHIIALHNSYNERTGVRHAVSWQAMRTFLGEVTP